MKKKKLLAILTAGAMVFAMTACGGETTGDTQTSGEPGTEVASEEAPTETQTPAETQAPETTDPVEEQGPVSIDFEDGLFGFAGIDKVVNPSSDDCVIELGSFNGSQALKVTSTQNKAVYVAIQADALLGDAAANLSSVEMSIGIENPDGTFQSASGNIYGIVGENNDQTSEAWAVYLESVNPKTVSYTVPDGYSFGAGNYIVVSLETDTGKDNGATPAVMYIDNIAFKDASGNVLTADTSAEFVAADTGEDRSNLYAVSGAVNFEGFACSEGAWTQNGFEMTEDFLNALVPGSVIEISYSSENGDMWIVMPWAEAGWMRVGDGTNGKAYINNSKNIAQITYEQIEAYCGSDKATWGAMLQCEASGAWEVYSVKVGTASKQITLANAVEFEGFACSEGGWTQNGFEMTEDFLNALQPGTVIEVQYSSENGDMWIVMPWAEAGWMRVGDGTNGTAITNGSTCYVTYEMIEEFCGTDKATWGAMLQCEASGAWEVYSVKVGTPAYLEPLNNIVAFEGFACSEGAWTQNGFEMTEDFLNALQPGTVIQVQYTSENGDMWIVMPWAEAGWMRVGDGTNGTAARNGSICQIPYEMIEEYCGTDKATWGAMLQCEASGAWEVYSVVVGQKAQ